MKRQKKPRGPAGTVPLHINLPTATLARVDARVAALNAEGGPVWTRTAFVAFALNAATVAP